MPTTPLAEHALAAIARGWHVFPLVPGGSTAALKRWEARATIDPELARRAWAADEFNIGLATGPSKLVVLDFDVPKPGKPVPERWAQQGAECGMDVFLILCAEAGQTPPLETFTVTTPSGGTHLYFTAPPEVELRITQGERGNGLGWGIDTRAWGGYVVAPGSHRRDGSYAITHDRAPIPLPAWLVDRLRPTPLPPQQPTPVTPLSTHRSRYLDAALAAELKRVEAAEGGDRNFTLYCAANALGQLVAGGALSEQEVTERLLEAARAHVAAGAYRWNQARQTIASGLRAGAKRPRKVAA